MLPLMIFRMREILSVKCCHYPGATIFCSWIIVITQNGGRATLSPIDCRRQLGEKQRSSSELEKYGRTTRTLGFPSILSNISIQFDYFWMGYQFWMILSPKIIKLNWDILNKSLLKYSKTHKTHKNFIVVPIITFDNLWDKMYPYRHFVKSWWSRSRM